MRWLFWQFAERFRAAGGIRRDEDVSRGQAARPERRLTRRDPWIGRDDRADHSTSRECRACPDRTGAGALRVLSGMLDAICRLKLGSLEFSRTNPTNPRLTPYRKSDNDRWVRSRCRRSKPISAAGATEARGEQRGDHGRRTDDARSSWPGEAGHQRGSSPARGPSVQPGVSPGATISLPLDKVNPGGL